MNEPLKPRRDLREEAFRRYEMYIGRALNGNITLDPIKELGLSSATFVARFRDAITGKIRYHYHSSVVPDTSNLVALKAYELASGLVLIKNTTLAEAPQTESSLTEENIVQLMTDIASKKYAPDNQISVTYRDIAELQHILAVAEMYPDIDCVVREHQGKVIFYTV